MELDNGVLKESSHFSFMVTFTSLSQAENCLKESLYLYYELQDIKFSIIKIYAYY